MTDLVTWAPASLSFAGENMEVEIRHSSTKDVLCVTSSRSRAVTPTIGQLVSGLDDPCWHAFISHYCFIPFARHSGCHFETGRDPWYGSHCGVFALKVKD